MVFNKPEWYDGEWCKRCNRHVAVGFSVSNAVWTAVVKGRYNVLCLPCFDELSDDTDIWWEDNIQFWPVSSATIKRDHAEEVT